MAKPPNRKSLPPRYQRPEVQRNISAPNARIHIPPTGLKCKRVVPASHELSSTLLGDDLSTHSTGGSPTHSPELSPARRSTLPSTSQVGFDLNGPPAAQAAEASSPIDMMAAFQAIHHSLIPPTPPPTLAGCPP